MEFAACRYNGDKISEPVVSSLADYVEFIPVCPEVEIGLGTPREVIRLVVDGEKNQLIQPKTKKNLTQVMTDFADDFITSLTNTDGFLLKSRSPSCGITDAKIYARIDNSPVVRTGSGTFTSRIQAAFPGKPIEDEGRLKNFIIREHYFTHLFTVTDFRIMKQDLKMKELVNFHAKNKYLFMACNQVKMREMGRVVANQAGLEIDEVFSLYEQGLNELFATTVKLTAHINVCQHVFGYFSNQLTSAEKLHFEQLLDQYRKKQIPLSSVLGVLRSWCYRFENAYLLMQTYFEPYPEGLIAISDSGKGRALS